MRGCQGFTRWHGDRLLPSDTDVKGEAGGRGRGSNGETPIEEGLSYFMRKKTNKQTKRSKEKGKKGNHGAFSKEPKTAISASRGVGKFSFVLMKGLEAYVDPKKNTHKSDASGLATEGSIWWCPFCLLASCRDESRPQDDSHSQKVEFLAWSWGSRDKGLDGWGPALAFSLPTPHGIKMPGAEPLMADPPPMPLPTPNKSVTPWAP